MKIVSPRIVDCATESIKAKLNIGNYKLNIEDFISAR